MGALTNSKGHDLQLLPDHLHHPGLLQGRHSAAENGAASLRQLHEAVLQVRRQRHGQGASVDHQRDVLGGVYVPGISAVPPHLLQGAVQDGSACDLDRKSPIDMPGFAKVFLRKC